MPRGNAYGIGRLHPGLNLQAADSVCDLMAGTQTTRPCARSAPSGRGSCRARCCSRRPPSSRPGSGTAACASPSGRPCTPSSRLRPPASACWRACWRVRLQALRCRRHCRCCRTPALPTPRLRSLGVGPPAHQPVLLEHTRLLAGETWAGSAPECSARSPPVAHATPAAASASRVAASVRNTQLKGASVQGPRPSSTCATWRARSGRTRCPPSAWSTAPWPPAWRASRRPCRPARTAGARPAPAWQPRPKVRSCGLGCTSWLLGPPTPLPRPTPRALRTQRRSHAAALGAAAPRLPLKRPHHLRRARSAAALPAEPCPGAQESSPRRSG